MTLSKRGYQYGLPIAVASLDGTASAQVLERVRLAAAIGTENQYDEAWLQRVIHRNPTLLPVDELEPGLGALIPVAMELPMPAGKLDNLFVTAEGHLVLVECKLWRNPEARRRVLAQIIDYAQNVSTWRYEELDSAIKRTSQAAGGSAGQGLFDIVQRGSPEALELDEAQFVDAVQRNLRRGRMLLLVVGDGIREDTESLTDFLQQHAGFHFTLALIETAVYVMPQTGYLVQARILARTLNIERAVIRIDDGAMVVTATTTTTTSAPAVSKSLSEEAYFDLLRSADPSTAAALESFATKLRDVGVIIDVATKSAVLKWSSPSGRNFTLGAVDTSGRLITWSVGWGPKLLGQAKTGHWYLERLATLMGAQVKRTKTEEQWYIVVSGTTATLPHAKNALDRQDEWMSLVVEYQKALTEAEGAST